MLSRVRNPSYRPEGSSVGRYAEKYTDAQRAAVTAAVLDQGMKAREARDALAAGELDAEAILMPLTSVNAYVSKERQKRIHEKVHPLVKRSAEEAVRTAIEIHASTVLRLAERTARSRNPQPRRLTDIAQALKATKQLLEQPKPQPSGGRDKTLREQEQQAGNGNQPQPSGLLNALRQEHQSTTPTPQPTPAERPRSGSTDRPEGPAATRSRSEQASRSRS